MSKENRNPNKNNLVFDTNNLKEALQFADFHSTTTNHNIESDRRKREGVTLEATAGRKTIDEILEAKAKQDKESYKTPSTITSPDQQTGTRITPTKVSAPGFDVRTPPTSPNSSPTAKINSKQQERF